MPTAHMAMEGLPFMQNDVVQPVFESYLPVFLARVFEMAGT
jgi:hypothetical protein